MIKYEEKGGQPFTSFNNYLLFTSFATSQISHTLFFLFEFLTTGLGNS